MSYKTISTSRSNLSSSPNLSIHIAWRFSQSCATEVFERFNSACQADPTWSPHCSALSPGRASAARLHFGLEFKQVTIQEYPLTRSHCSCLLYFSSSTKSCSVFRSVSIDSPSPFTLVSPSFHPLVCLFRRLSPVPISICCCSSPSFPQTPPRQAHAPFAALIFSLSFLLLRGSVRSSSERRPLRSFVLDRGKSTSVSLAFSHQAHIPSGVPLNLVEPTPRPPWRRLRPSLAHSDDSVFPLRVRRRSLPSSVPQPFASQILSITSLALLPLPSRPTAPTRASPSASSATHTLCSPFPSADAVASPRLRPPPPA